MNATHLCTCLGVFVLAACTGGGPSTRAITDNDGTQTLSSPSDDSARDYVLVDLSPDMARLASSAAARAQPAFFPRSGAAPVTIGAGDILDISIVVTSENGFIDFTQSQVSPVSTTNLPSQEVGSDGNVNVPPIGRVRAAGQSVQQFERFLARRLGEILVDPSVIVRLSDRRSAQVAVMGAVNAPGSYALNQSNQHLIDTLALAGGPTGRSDELTLSLSRAGQQRSAPLRDVYARSGLNVHLRPGDVISLEENLTQIRVLGALGVNATLDFEEAEVTLAAALAKAGGIASPRGDKSGIFIYRDAPKSAASALGADVGAFPGDTAPIIYRLDMTEPDSLFAAERFAMMDGDILYVADSVNAQIRNVFGVTTFLAPSPAEYVRDATLE